MASKFSRWLGSVRRYFSTPTTIRKARRHQIRGHMERLESKIAPALFAGGISVASGDVNGDGFNDMVVGAGQGGTPRVTAYNGRTGAIIRSWDVFDPSFTGGVNVAVGDLNGDGRADVVVGAGRGGQPQVKAYDVVTGFKLHDFLAYNKRFIGGVNVATADLTGEGKADIITGAGSGGSPHVAVFDGTTGKNILNILAYDAKFLGGVSVAGGDVTGDGKADIITGAGPGGGPMVRVFEPFNSSRNSTNFMAFNRNYTGGVNVGVANINGTGGLDIVTGAGPGGGPHVKVFDSANNKELKSFYAYQSTYTGGVDVATTGSDLNGLGISEILVGEQTNGGSHVRAFDGETMGSVANFFAFGETTANPIVAPAFAGAKDTVAPTLTITSPTGSPTQRTNLTVTGNAKDDRTGTGSVSVQVKVDNGAFQNVAVSSNGTFSFTTSFNLTGQQDGKHTLTFQARDKSGNLSSSSTVSFTLDSFVTVPVVDLDSASDTGTQGDLITSKTSVTLTGKTDANTDVTLVQTGATAKSDSSGKFSFTAVPLVAGPNEFTIRATDSLGNTSDGKLTVTLNSAPTVTDPIDNVTVSQNAANTVINLSKNFGDVDIVNTLVRFNTNLGPVEVELFDQQAPLTVANFLNYVRRGDFNNSIFHRLVNNFVLQGGGFKFTPSPGQLTAITTDPAVQNEPGIPNTRGTIAMAKFGGAPDSATSQFFFNLADNANLNTQNGGFTVFGEIRTGIDIIEKFAEYPITNQGGVFNELPLTDYTGANFPTDTVFNNYAGINSISLVRRSDRLSFSVVSNSNTALVTTSVSGNNLTLDYVANQTGTATITIRATDLDGSFVDNTFTVTVN